MTARTLTTGLIAVLLVAGCGSGEGEQTSAQLMAKLKLRMSAERLHEVAGQPTRSFTSSTENRAKFEEYDTKDGTVAVTLVDGQVSDFTDAGAGGAVPTPQQAPTGASQ
jgi:hypothetical protein